MNKKFLSQNFLIDQNIKKKIIDSININKNDIILEIGAGNGAISKDLSILAKQTILIEIDTSLIPHLKNKLKHINNKEIYNDDILKFNTKDIIKKYKMLRIIGNIPYKISTKIILNFIKFKKNIKDMHLVIQKEISNRLIKNNKFYSSSSVIIKYHFNIINIFDIKPNSFKPIPKIKSSFIKLIPKKNDIKLLNYEIFKNIIKSSFNKKRKKIYKSIKNIKQFKKYINIYKRAENTTLNEYIRISNLLSITKND